MGAAVVAAVGAAAALLTVALAGLGAPAAAAGPRWLCESMDAQGALVHDTCGPCYLDNAPRWAPPEAAFVVDEGQVPAGVGEAAWQAAAEDAMAAWTGVTGSALSMTPSSGGSGGGGGGGGSGDGEAGPRAFGAVDDVHELFWIGDAKTWAAETLTGKGTLALSAVRYTCGEPRVIFDADTALNGAAFAPPAGADAYWAPSCDGAPGCRSVRHVIAHELGHAAGLGHPCVDCRTSIMLAVTVEDFQPETPLPNDEDALRALYPTPEPAETDDEGGPEAAPEPGPEPATDVGADGASQDAEIDAGAHADPPPGCGDCAGGRAGGNGRPVAPWLGLALGLWLGLRARTRRSPHPRHRPGRPA